MLRHLKKGLELCATVYYFIIMPKKLIVETKVYAVRLPVKLLHLLKKVASTQYRSVNAQIQMAVEDWLVAHGHMKDSERRKL